MKKAEKKLMAALAVEDVEAMVREMCIASVRNDEAVAKMNEEIARARERHEPDIAAAQATWDDLFARVQIWAEAHPDLFASKKSLAMVHGTVGFRTGQPTLKLKRGITWEGVVETLKRMAPAYVRCEESADRQALVAREAEFLAKIGLERNQAERFFVEPNKEAAKLEQAQPSGSAA